MVRAMTTLKPQLVRADTLDLQDHDTPSAKDHSRQPAHPSPYGYGPAAPHQAQTLRQAEQDAYQEQHTSPRQSEDKTNGAFGYSDHDDDRNDDHNTSNGSNGPGYNGQDINDEDGGDSHDEDMDDDLLDKISSSPSIEDGKYTLPVWPPRADSVRTGAAPAPAMIQIHDSPLSSSPYISHYKVSPPQSPRVVGPESHHGECEGYYANRRMEVEPWQDHDQTSSLTSFTSNNSGLATQLQGIPLSESQEFRRYLLPTDDPLLRDVIDAQSDEYFYDEEGDWEDDDSSVADPDLSSDDDPEDFQFSNDDRFIDSGWGGECLREIEDIDFEFVYALHTFVATVEGQANATKGDTMVLLDDSNSYWWLVRVVKDGSIGYLPAEHIETPTERLARLNKHRNIDLSASMLGDNPEKSKNPLKKAMRRRNAKTVQFAPPTYYEPSDYEYSDEEDDGNESLTDQGIDDNADDDTHNDQEVVETEPESQGQRVTATANGVQRMASTDSLKSDLSSDNSTRAQQQEATLVEQNKADEAVSRSRKGVVRNTDSFFRDDTVETKKISLTPRLLRGDSESGQTTEQEVRQRQSLDTFDRIVASDDKTKEKEKEKEKDKKKEKKGMLSGLFKRKKGTPQEESVERPSEELRRSPQSKDSMESVTYTKPESGPERKPSKLQKTPPIASPKSSPTEPRAPQRELMAAATTAPPSVTPREPTGPAPAPPTLRKVESESELADDTLSTAPQSQPTTQVNRFPSLTEKRSIFAPITTALKSTSSSNSDTRSPVKPIYSKRAKERFAIDDEDSEDYGPTPKADDQTRNSVSPLADNLEEPVRSDSVVRVSPVDSLTPINSQTQKGLDVRTTPLPIETGHADSEGTASTSKPSPSTATHTPSTSRSTPTWSDASLRSYMENDQEIKDLLIIVHDKSNVTPVGADHPLMSNLFSNERSKLAEMQLQLDSMLMSWMGKKNSSLLSATT
ncbi:hypothetical protein LTR84_009973 [Exophiala bonariae]|uniref:SH3 domain-containing protein n=1 Tax=Exophiala bonariae TaxID=1690606 RepID=A0AAV9NJQ9_9EURO|nr:hypothetical protein LTR84_009973 [Exophiala bonariae]